MITTSIIIALALFFAFRVIYLVKNKLPISEKSKQIFSYMLPVFELLLWVSFVLWISWKIYISKNYFALISIGIVFVLFFVPITILIRDFISGVILKLQNKINEGNYIEIEDIKGNIKNAGHFRIDIKDNQGNIGSIPYYTIRSKIIKKQSDNLFLEKIHLTIEVTGEKRVNEVIPEVKRKILNTPWVAVSQEPIVEEVKPENGHTKITFGIYTLNKLFEENIREVLEEVEVA